MSTTPIPKPDDEEEENPPLSPGDQLTLDALIEAQQHPELYGDPAYMTTTDQHEQLTEDRIPTVCLKCKHYPCTCADS